MNRDEIVAELFRMRDKDYAVMQVKIVPTVAADRSEEYYVNMMIAWYFATALAKQYVFALPYLEEKRLTDWVHNKTIQKSVESYRIADEHKAYLKTLKIRQGR